MLSQVLSGRLAWLSPCKRAALPTLPPGDQINDAKV